ncbi:MAG TPA: hypothetical protein VK815_15515 [Candidatus Acidoferrales bacterium]|jgi:hypothetical protein|nr:hypothetical protein [Candidatus Acidoferrales bacterium]
MNAKAHKFFAPVMLLVPACALLTGCPHNDYTVELKPTAHGVERTLTFYRLDGNNSNGVPNYQGFPSNELMAITQVYPANAVKWDGQQHVAKAEFAGAMPKDVGGAGSYTNYITSLGESGFYSERFRGSDDLAARTLKQFHAADQLTDLVIGWSKTEFGREQGYKNLRKFLDEDLRRDLKNAGQYFTMAAASNLSDTNAPEEFVVRFSQYLFERGYVKPADAPQVAALMNGSSEDQAAFMDLVSRLVTDKLETPFTVLSPKVQMVLTNNDALVKSWEGYLAKSDLYRAKHKEWEAEVKTNPKLDEPKPADAANDLFMGLLGVSSGFGGEADHLTVKLALKHAPDHSNGKWQDGLVVWDNELDKDRPLPVLCYASWNNPDEMFQKAHFGRVLLEGDELSKYNLWRSGLSEQGSREWDAFLAGLQPGAGLKKQIEAFLPAHGEDQFEAGRNLLTGALTPTASGTPAAADSKQVARAFIVL